MMHPQRIAADLPPETVGLITELETRLTIAAAAAVAMAASAAAMGDGGLAAAVAVAAAIAPQAPLTSHLQLVVCVCGLLLVLLYCLDGWRVLYLRQAASIQ
jgi:hypothetical protein